MKVKITKELKKQLLQAIMVGELETDIFHKEDTRTIGEIEAEIKRLALLDGEKPFWLDDNANDGDKKTG
jgi:soluble P-type ATPase